MTKNFLHNKNETQKSL